VASGLPGVDVSSFQGAPAQWRAEAGDIAWAAVKITELSSIAYVNPDAAADWAYLKQRGLVRVAYAFGHPGTSAAASASFFAGQLAALGVEDGDAVALDLEVTDGLGPAAVAAWARAVMAALARAFGRAPLLYTFRSFAGAGNCEGLAPYPLWISDPDHPAGHPQIPAPWTSWAIHQFSISGGIDRDFAGWLTPAAMRAALGRPGAVHPPAAPVPAEEPGMILVQVDQVTEPGGTLPQGTPWPGVFLVAPGATPHHVTSGADVKAYQAAGVKGPVTISYGEYQGWAG
jgi:lysozyme